MADPLAALTRADLQSALLTPAQVAVFTPRMSREIPTSLGSSRTVGKGGTCSALATLVDSGAPFRKGGAQGDIAQVSYVNVTAVGGKQKKVRGISQIVQVVPGGDLTPVLGQFRAAVAGCSTPLINQDGTRMKLSLLPDPRGLGAHAITLESTSVNPPGAHDIPLEGVFEIAVSGSNAISIGTMGYASTERAKITAQAWKNLITRP